MISGDVSLHLDSVPGSAHEIGLQLDIVVESSLIAGRLRCRPTTSRAHPSSRLDKAPDAGQKEPQTISILSLNTGHKSRIFSHHPVPFAGDLSVTFGRRKSSNCKAHLVWAVPVRKSRG